MIKKLLLLSLLIVIGCSSPPDGPFKEYHEEYGKPTSVLKAEGTYKDGKLDGPYKSYGHGYGGRESDNLMFETTYKDGEEYGSIRYMSVSFRNSPYISLRSKQYKDENGLSTFELTLYHRNPNYIKEKSTIKSRTLPYDTHPTDLREDGISSVDGIDTFYDGLFKAYHDNGGLAFKITFKDGKEHGLSELYHENGQLEARTHYKNGIEDGLSETYHDNGELQLKLTYKDGKEEGPSNVYDSGGRLLVEKTYKDGIEQGPSRHYYIFSDISAEERFKRNYSGKFYKPGESFAHTELNYKNGKLHGPYKEYSIDSGLLILSINYKDGKLHGEFREEDERKNYQKFWTKNRILANYKDGELHGEYFWSGTIGSGSIAEKQGKHTTRGKGTYKDGKKEGYWEYRENMKESGWSGGEKEGTYKNDLKDGLWKEYSVEESFTQHGNTVYIKFDIEKTYKDGILHGSYKERYVAGSEKKDASYKNGKLHGPYKEYEFVSNGKKEGTYKNGIEDGHWKYYTTYMKQNGGLEKEINYKNGLRDGLYIQYETYTKGKFIETYKEGLLHGSAKYYYPGGKLSSEVTYVNGKQTGHYKKYYKNGKIEKEGTVKDGIVHGSFKKYYENGQLKSDGIYKNGLKDGVYKEYHENGTLRITATYKDDIRVQE
jgi:antitoxin component YwqK of YwqJK toxin-antitoxin module